MLFEDILRRNLSLVKPDVEHLQKTLVLYTFNTNLVKATLTVGAGSSGSVVASRLAEDMGHSVLLLEAGGEPWPLMDIPAITPFLQSSDFDWQYKTVPQYNACLGLKQNSSRWPRGKILGGSSRLNFMLYLRGDPRDYDSWEEEGNPGWSYRQVLPFFKLAENQQGRYKHDKKHHGSKGPLTVSDVSWKSNLASAFLNAGQEIGYEIGDLNGELNSGFMYSQHTMQTGQRYSCDSAYLKKRKNLLVLTHAHVEKVLFRNSNEVFAVRFKHNGELKVAVAMKEVILSSGAIGSPHVLLLSGIGPIEQLKKYKIPVVADLDGVGKNLQDHVNTGSDIVQVTRAKDSLNLDMIRSPINLWNYVWSQSGILTNTGVEASAFVHTNISLDPRPDIQLMLMPIGFSTDCGTFLHRIAGISDQIGEKYLLPMCNQGTGSIFTVLLRPESHGEIKLQSSNPMDYPLIDPRYLSNKKDVKTLIEGLRIVENLLTTSAFSELGVHLNKNPMPGCEALQFGSDAYWECHIRHLTLTTYHPAGTCRMGPANKKDSVVDATLRVHGVKRLRVVDVSIMPSIVGANPNAAAVMIGEKAAHMIRAIWWNSCTWIDFYLSIYQCHKY